TYDAAIVPRLYDAYAEKRNVGALDYVRIGRQSLWDTPELAWFDGVSIETQPSGSKAIQGGVYGGLSVYPYENSRSGDAIAGLYGMAHPWAGGRARVDWMHMEDDSLLGPNADDLWRFLLGHTFAHDVDVEAQYTRIEDADRDVRLTASWNDTKDDLTLQASYYELLRTQGNLATGFDPFCPTLFELFPYRQTQLLFSKGLGAKVDFSGGYDARRVSENSDIQQFNRDFDRWFGTFAFRDTLPADIVAAITGEVWDATDARTETWGLDLSRRFDPKLGAALGSYYALFKIDVFTATEREDVRTYYLRLRWHRTTSTTWDLRYEHEDAEPETFDSVKVGLTWNF